MKTVRCLLGHTWPASLAHPYCPICRKPIIRLAQSGPGVKWLTNQKENDDERA